MMNDQSANKALNTIVQWNMESYRTKFSELKLLSNSHHPAGVCLQETLIRHAKVYRPSQYNIVTSPVTREDRHERGAAVLINRCRKYDTVALRIVLQVAAVKLYLNKVYTVCSVYLPHVPVAYEDLQSLVQQLEPPFIVMGDMNSRSALWCDVGNERSRLFERLLIEEDIVILNYGYPTYYSRQHDSYSVVDLTICSSDYALDFQYQVNESLHGSDHYPIRLSIINDSGRVEKVQSFNTSKADWAKFRRLTCVNSEGNYDDAEVFAEEVTGILQKAANESIPRRSGKIARPPVPWWYQECAVAKRERLRAERAMKRNNTPETRTRYSRARAVCKRLFDKCRRESWKRYLSSINARTSMKEM